MPLAPYLWRYRPLDGDDPDPVSPAALTPPEDDDSTPAFDPTMSLADNNQSQNPVPPQAPSLSSARADLSLPTNGQSGANTIPLSPLNDASSQESKGSPSYSGLKKLAMMMPPPGAPAAANGGSNGASNGASNGSGGGYPGSVETAMGVAAANAIPADTVTTGPNLPPTAPPTQAPSIVPPPDISSQMPAPPGAGPSAPPPSPAELANAGVSRSVSNSSVPTSPSSTAATLDAINKLHAGRPSAPTSNWAQRLAGAILAMTKLAPVANQIVHPNYSAAMSAYQNKEADLQEQLKEQEGAEDIATKGIQRRSNALKLAAQAQELADIPNQKKVAEQDRIHQAFITSMGKNAIALNPGEPIPGGYHPFQDPTDPNTIYVRPSAFISLTKELLPLFPGKKEGDLVTSTEYDQGQQAYRAQQLENLKAENKPDKTPGNEAQLALQAQDPDPKISGPAKAALATLVSQHKSEHPETTINLTPEAIQGVGQQYGTTGQLPALGYGKEGAAMRANILNNYFKGHPDANPASAAAVFRADADSLKKLQSNRDAVLSFENTAGKNLDLFTNQAKKVIDSGSPWINKPLRSIDRNALGNTDVAAFDAARQVALNEVAKVVSNPGLSGQLSDSARKEVESLSPKDATLAQIYHVVGVIKQDMANRHQSYDQMLAEIRGRFPGGANGTPGSKPDPAGLRHLIPATQ